MAKNENVREDNQNEFSKKATFFVAIDGNDKWSGRLSKPNTKKTDGPFATLVKARDSVREIKTKDGLKKPITVMVREGKYFLNQTFVLSAKDSGTQDCPITYTAYPGEKPILSGGKKITGWKPYKDKILQCELPGAKGGKWKFRQLFFNGKRQIRARYPNFDSENPLYGGWAFVEGPADEGSISAHKFKGGYSIMDRSLEGGKATAFRCKPETFKHHWSKPTEGEVNVFPGAGWCNNIIPIKAVDEEKHIITLTREISQLNRPPWYFEQSFIPNNRFIVENILEELDQPREWCLDSEEGILYFWPPQNTIGPADEVVVPMLDCLIDLAGISWINISGFTFTETLGGDDLFREGSGGYGPMFPRQGWKYCGEAMHLKGAEYCCIENNHFYAVGGNAIYLESYNTRNLIQHNEISYTGAGGICLLGTTERHSMFNQVLDNEIHHCGVIHKYVDGVFMGLSDGNVIRHNYIHHMPHHAIDLGSNGFGRNIVEYNEIRSTCLEADDLGAINSWMDTLNVLGGYVSKDAERAGHIIRYNFIADTRGCNVDEKGNISKGTLTWGIYLDDFTSNCFVYGNIIVRSDVGINVHSGKNNIIENNIIVECRIGVYYQNRAFYRPACWQMKGFNTGNRCCGNIFYITKEADKAFLFYFHDYTEKLLGGSENNLFFNATGKYEVYDYNSPDKLRSTKNIVSFEKWQKQGYDTHSCFEDPQFVDPEHDDYRLKPESPAFKLGFQAIGLDRIGIRKWNLKKCEKMGTI